MMDMLCIGRAPEGSTPFNKDGRFDTQGGRKIDYGHTFDAERGYRVFFKFADSAAANTWGAISLLKWAEAIIPENIGQVEIKRIAIQQARQCITLNREWESRGYPIVGIPMEAKGQA